MLRVATAAFFTAALMHTTTANAAFLGIVSVCCFSVYLVTNVPHSAVVPVNETIRDAWVKETVGPWPEACLRPWEPLVVGSALRHPEGRSEA